MTKISAQVIADSKNEFGNRITTMVVTFPRFILAELNTHRMFSRNSASSRAIPFEKMVKSIKENPFIPIAFQKDHKGMQGTDYFTGQEEIVVRNAWNDMRWRAVEEAERVAELGLTKQLCNRPLEAYMWHTVIVTATEWENFFALRCPKYSLFYEQIPIEFRSKKDLIKFTKQVEAPEFQNSYDNLTQLEWLQINKGQAEIHMMELAEQMWDAMGASTPKELKAGEWHIPFGDGIDWTHIQETLPNVNEMDRDEVAIKIATARCARVSYTVVGEEGKEANYENDIKLHDNLVKSGHWSPAEHCAKAMSIDEYYSKAYNDGYLNKSEIGWSGNFKGFIQYRKTFQGENIIKI
jgi:thymidylate synthase ThyX